MFGPCVYPKQRDTKSQLYVCHIYKSTFDTVDRELLYYCLLNNGIDGKFYYNIKTLYTNTQSRVRLDNINTNWFQCNVGVRQGDNLSPTLLALFINDLAINLKALNKGVQIDNYNTSVSSFVCR